MNLLIASTSTLHGTSYLEYLNEEMSEFFVSSKEILFVPYARPGGISWDEYTALAKSAFSKIGLNLSGIHEKEDPLISLETCDGVFVGGGNTFVLLSELYSSGVIEPLRQKVAEGLPYMGTSAGSNILGTTIRTTNDMPIVYPPSFDALAVVPFTINPHYLDPPQNSKHMGETRETRIKEYLVFNDTKVVGLREGSYLRVSGKQIELKGSLSARVFSRDQVTEVMPGANLSSLWNE